MNTNKYFKEKRAGQSHKLKLFCFPYAGGNASIYQGWENDLDKEVSLVTVHLKGRMERMAEPAINDMSTLINELFENIKPFLNEPFAFFGHSLGGLVAFVLLKKIENELGVTAEKIIISASRPPHIYAQNKMDDYSDEHLTQKIKNYGNTPAYVLESQELMELILPTIRADYQVLDSCPSQDNKPLSSELIIFNCDDDIDKEISVQWEKYFQEKSTYVDFEEGHFFINTQREKTLCEVSKVLVTVS